MFIPIEQRIERLMSRGTINAWVLGLGDGTMSGSIEKPTTAQALLELAREGSGRVILGDQMWSLWSDGYNSMAFRVTQGSPQSKSVVRALRRAAMSLCRPSIGFGPIIRPARPKAVA